LLAPYFFASVPTLGGILAVARIIAGIPDADWFTAVGLTSILLLTSFYFLMFFLLLASLLLLAPLLLLAFIFMHLFKLLLLFYLLQAFILGLTSLLLFMNLLIPNSWCLYLQKETYYNIILSY
jgi:hypothetical protein